MNSLLSRAFETHDSDAVSGTDRLFANALRVSRHTYTVANSGWGRRPGQGFDSDEQRKAFFAGGGRGGGGGGGGGSRGGNRRSGSKGNTSSPQLQDSGWLPPPGAGRPRSDTERRPAGSRSGGQTGLGTPEQTVRMPDGRTAITGGAQAPSSQWGNAPDLVAARAHLQRRQYEAEERRAGRDPNRPSESGHTWDQPVADRIERQQEREAQYTVLRRANQSVSNDHTYTQAQLNASQSGYRSPPVGYDVEHHAPAAAEIYHFRHRHAGATNMNDSVTLIKNAVRVSCDNIAIANRPRRPGQGFEDDQQRKAFFAARGGSGGLSSGGGGGGSRSGDGGGGQSRSARRQAAPTEWRKRSNDLSLTPPDPGRAYTDIAPPPGKVWAYYPDGRRTAIPKEQAAELRGQPPPGHIDFNDWLNGTGPGNLIPPGGGARPQPIDRTTGQPIPSPGPGINPPPVGGVGVLGAPGYRPGMVWDHNNARWTGLKTPVNSPGSPSRPGGHIDFGNWLGGTGSGGLIPPGGGARPSSTPQTTIYSPGGGNPMRVPSQVTQTEAGQLLSRYRPGTQEHIQVLNALGTDIRITPDPRPPARPTQPAQQTSSTFYRRFQNRSPYSASSAALFSNAIRVADDYITNVRIRSHGRGFKSDSQRKAFFAQKGSGNEGAGSAGGLRPKPPMPSMRIARPTPRPNPSAERTGKPNAIARVVTHSPSQSLGIASQLGLLGGGRRGHTAGTTYKTLFDESGRSVTVPDGLIDRDTATQLLDANKGSAQQRLLADYFAEQGVSAHTHHANLPGLPTSAIHAGPVAPSVQTQINPMAQQSPHPSENPLTQKPQRVEESNPLNAARQEYARAINDFVAQGWTAGNVTSDGVVLSKPGEASRFIPFPDRLTPDDGRYWGGHWAQPWSRHLPQTEVPVELIRSIPAGAHEGGPNPVSIGASVISR